MVSKYISDFSTPSTMLLFKKRWSTLNLQFMGYGCFIFPASLAILGLTYFYPTIPPLWNSLIRTHNSGLVWTLALHDTYTCLVLLETIAIVNLITWITFGSLTTTGMQFLSSIFKTESNVEKYLAANRAYTTYQVIIDRLTSIFSVSILFQEGFLLTSTTTMIAFGVKSKLNGQNAIFLSIMAYIFALEAAFLVISQFYPIIMLYMYSTETLQLMTAFTRKNKHAKAIARRSRLLKVRPMNVHTITLDTLFDYVMFIVSVLLTLLAA